MSNYQFISFGTLLALNAGDFREFYKEVKCLSVKNEETKEKDGKTPQ